MFTFLKRVGFFFDRKFIPIRVKFTISMVVTMLVFGAINFSISYVFVKQSALEHIGQKVELVVHVIHTQLQNDLDAGDFAKAGLLISDAEEGDSEIHYILVLDGKGKILASTLDAGQLPEFQLNGVVLDLPDYYFDKRAGERIHNRVFPIREGVPGSIVFGTNESAASGLALRFGFIMIAMIVFFLVLGIGGSMIFSYFISDPIYKILKGFDAFVPGGDMPEVRTRVNDELRLLAHGFRSMMERINEIDRNYKSTQTKILETERLASMGTLATGLAHEINNPIAGIQMCLRRVQKSQNLDARQTEYLLLISEATNHIKTVVQDLLSYAQESDRKKDATDLRAVVTDAAKLVQPRLNRNNIHFHLEMPPSACVIQGVKSHLVQVIVNGIINSIDAVHDSGNIWVTLLEKPDAYRITVEDDGPGIPPEVAAKAFEPFFTTKGKKGTGLGLYVSFGIIMAHHGKIDLRGRNSGQGTVLEVDLPIERDHEYSHR